MNTRIILIALSALVLGACGDDDAEPVAAPPIDDASGSDDADEPGDGAGEPAEEPADGADGDGDETVDGEWTVVALELDGRTVELLPDWPVTMTIDGDRIGGTAACNGYGGTVSIDRSGGGGSFQPTRLDVTEMACVDDGVMELEADVLAVLDRIDSYELAGDLFLAQDGGPTNMQLSRESAVVDAELAGIDWVLDTVISGDAASNSAAMADVVLRFVDDGTLTGSTGCRDLQGGWDVDGARLVVSSLAAVGDESACPAGSLEIERHVLAVIESGTVVAIEGDRLTLTAAGGDGLSLRVRGVERQVDGTP